MQFSDQVMADVNHWCPQLQAGAALITVNQRLARHYQRRYDAWQKRSGARVWDTPVILSWSAWLQQLHDGALAEGLTEYPVLNASLDESLWRDAVDIVSKNESGYPQLLDKTAAAQQARSAWLIQHAWHCHVGDEATLSLDQQAYAAWSNTFRRLCHQEKAVDQSRLATVLRELWAPLKEAALMPANVLFAGFLTPTVEQTCWWQGLTDTGIAVSQLQQAGDSVTPESYCFIDDASEWSSAASHARALLEENSSVSIGVVVPELQAHRTDVLRAFDAVFFPGASPADIQRQGRPYDVSLGVSLAEQPVVRSALQMLKFLTGRVPAADATSVLLSPYFLNARTAANSRRRLDAFLREQRCWEVSAGDIAGNERLAEKLDKSLAKVLPKAVSILSVKPATFTAWSDRFGRVFKGQLRWPGTDLDSLEYQAAQIWQQVIEEFESLDNGRTVSVETAVHALQRLCQQRLFQPETPTAQIQIMGRLESHGLSFDHLWLSGNDASQWPAKANATTLIPRSLQQDRGVPESSASMRLEAAKLEWAHWCCSSPSIIASHALTRDGQALLPAACVVDLPIKEEHQLKGFEQYPSLVDRIAESAIIKSVADTYGPALLAGVHVKGGARRLEDQAKCPFRGFATHHLGINEMEEPGMGLNARVHGTLLHTALEAFWGSVKTSAALHTMEESACDDEVQKSIEFALKECHVDAQLAELERPRVKRLIDDWLAVEKTRIVGFTVEAMEQENLVDLFGIKLRVMIDRIDRLETGERIIIDYKTGSNNRPAEWANDRIGNPQLPLYATIDPGVEGLSFAQVVQNNMGFKGLTADPMWLPRVSTKVSVPESPDDWEGWRRHWCASLEVLVAEVREGYAAITPEDKACMYCKLKPLCRYSPDAFDAVDEEASGER